MIEFLLGTAVLALPQGNLALLAGVGAVKGAGGTNACCSSWAGTALGVLVLLVATSVRPNARPESHRNLTQCNSDWSATDLPHSV